MAANAPRVISLGEESRQVLRRISALKPQPPAETITDLYGTDSYGRAGQLTVNGRRVEWLALAHRGLLRGTSLPVAINPRRRTRPGWMWLHEQWAARQQGR